MFSYIFIQPFFKYPNFLHCDFGLSLVFLMLREATKSRVVVNFKNRNRGNDVQLKTFIRPIFCDICDHFKNLYRK